MGGQKQKSPHQRKIFNNQELGKGNSPSFFISLVEWMDGLNVKENPTTWDND